MPSCSDKRPEDDGEGVTLREMYVRRARWEKICMFGDCPWDNGGMHGEL